MRVGHYIPNWAGDCIQQDGEPMWGHPPPPDPIRVCGADNAPRDISGTYRMRASGRWQPCLEAGGGEVREDGREIHLVVSQTPGDLSSGWAEVARFDHPLLEGRHVPATFTRQRFSASESYSNLPSDCPREYEILIRYDFEGFEAPGAIDVSELGSSDCTFCKGFIWLDIEMAE